MNVNLCIVVNSTKTECNTTEVTFSSQCSAAVSLVMGTPYCPRFLSVRTGHQVREIRLSVTWQNLASESNRFPPAVCCTQFLQTFNWAALPPGFHHKTLMLVVSIISIQTSRSRTYLNSPGIFLFIISTFDFFKIKLRKIRCRQTWKALLLNLLRQIFILSHSFLWFNLHFGLNVETQLIHIKTDWFFWTTKLKDRFTFCTVKRIFIVVIVPGRKEMKMSSPVSYTDITLRRVLFSATM